MYMCLELATKVCITHQEAHASSKLIIPPSEATDNVSLRLCIDLVTFVTSVLACQPVLSVCWSCLCGHVVEIPLV